MPRRRHEIPPATTLNGARTGDVMSKPIVTCHADVPLEEVAELMARHRIHAVVVLPDAASADDAPLLIVSELDLVRALSAGDAGMTAGRIAASPPVTIAEDEPLEQAALLMSDHETTHVVVVDGGQAVGIVSALDVAAALAPSPAAPSAGGGASPAAARPGDRLIIRGHHLGEVSRDAEILEARGAGGTPPYLVRWEDTGHVTLLYPGSDARVEHLASGA